ncbi:MAG: flagellar motor switch protein FliM [Clostridium sp.]|uniref:flagellar motor switch protein FliM n=1 Tax=Clostridium sp. TaxID=1506 RepID=UPI003F35A65D
MAEVLSQSEIDALLSALSTGEIEADAVKEEEGKQKVKLYDFRSPQKFSKDHIRTFELIYDDFARSASNYLTGQLRNNVKMKIETLQQITYDEFVHSVQNPTMMSIFKMPPLAGSLMIEVNPEFAFAIIDILLGGSGQKVKVNKEFSEIDKNIMKSVMTDMVKYMKGAWEDILEVSPEIEGLETNPMLNQSLAPNEPVVLITFSAEVSKTVSFINLCIPYLSVEKILDKLVVQYWFQNTEEDGIQKASMEKIRDGLDKIEVDIHADLGESQITVDDFLNLVIGDVIKLETKTTEPVKVYVEDEEAFIGEPGKIGKNMGVSILDIINEGVN